MARCRAVTHMANECSSVMSSSISDLGVSKGFLTNLLNLLPNIIKKCSVKGTGLRMPQPMGRAV